MGGTNRDSTLSSFWGCGGGGRGRPFIHRHLIFPLSKLLNLSTAHVGCCFGFMTDYWLDLPDCVEICRKRHHLWHSLQFGWSSSDHEPKIRWKATDTHRDGRRHIQTINVFLIEIRISLQVVRWMDSVERGRSFKVVEMLRDVEVTNDRRGEVVWCGVVNRHA